MKKIIVLMLSVFVFIFQQSVLGAVKDDTPIEFVLVLDCSGSLNRSDEQKLSVSAAKMFIDMLPSENARLSIVAFGNTYGERAHITEMMKNYQSPLVQDRITCAYALGDITSPESKAEAKTIIEQITTGVGETYTPMGFALDAACEILEAGHAASHSAAIVVLSDGRVSGQLDSYNGGKDFYSIDNAAAKAFANGWPVYCLELNYDQANTAQAAYPYNIAYYQMRQIPEKTNGEHIELLSASQAQKAFSDIFSKFFTASPQIQEGVIQSDSLVLDFTVDEMVAETNVILTGDIAGVSEIKLSNENGLTYSYTQSMVEEERIVTFDKQYIAAKLLIPKTGKWNVTVSGAAGVKIGMYAVSMREMNLQLSAAFSGDKDTISKGTEISFTASYLYNDTIYSSEAVYKNTDAYLVIEETGERFPMVGGTNNYTGVVKFSNEGTYTVKACVEESGLFRNGRKESGGYVFSVTNHPVSIAKEMEAVQLSPGGSLEIDCTQYFKDEDNESFSYEVSVPQTANITAEFSESGILTLRAGTQTGEYEIKLIARDSSSKAELSFLMTVENQPLKLNGKDKAAYRFITDKQGLPEAVLSLFDFDFDMQGEIYFEEFFEDSDGMPPIIELSEKQNHPAITVAKDTDKLILTATENGEATYILKATDASDSSLSCTITLVVTAQGAFYQIWQSIKLFVYLAIGLLIVLFIIWAAGKCGRKIYGVWDLTYNKYVENDTLLKLLPSGGKTKCKLTVLIQELTNDSSVNFGKITVIAGNCYEKKVIFKGLKQAQRVVLNDKVVKKNTLKLKKGDTLKIEYCAGQVVIMTRL